MKLVPGTVAAITGAGSGIGRAVALALAHERCALALADVQAATLEETAALARGAQSPAVTTHIVDVADREAVRRFADEAVERHGGVQLLMNNAGAALGGTFAEVTLEDFAWLIGMTSGALSTGSSTPCLQAGACRSPGTTKPPRVAR
jgi:NADP-dependent 3-hydroxy acid dehydrogenase YdfG